MVGPESVCGRDWPEGRWAVQRFLLRRLDYDRFRCLADRASGEMAKEAHVARRYLEINGPVVVGTLASDKKYVVRAGQYDCPPWRGVLVEEADAET